MSWLQGFGHQPTFADSKATTVADVAYTPKSFNNVGYRSDSGKLMLKVETSVQARLPELLIEHFLDGVFPAMQ